MDGKRSKRSISLARSILLRSMLGLVVLLVFFCWTQYTHTRDLARLLFKDQTRAVMDRAKESFDLRINDPLQATVDLLRLSSSVLGYFSSSKDDQFLLRVRLEHELLRIRQLNTKDLLLIALFDENGDQIAGLDEGRRIRKPVKIFDLPAGVRTAFQNTKTSSEVQIAIDEQNTGTDPIFYFLRRIDDPDTQGYAAAMLIKYSFGSFLSTIMGLANESIEISRLKFGPLWVKGEDVALAEKYESRFTEPLFGEPNFLTIDVKEQYSKISENLVYDLLANIGVALLITLFVLVLLSAVFNSALHPIEALQRSTHRIAQGDYHGRIAQSGFSEVDGLIEDFEKMRLELKIMFGSLRQQKDLLESVIKNMGDGLLVIDTKGAVLLSNNLAEELYGKENAIVRDMRANHVSVYSAFSDEPIRAEDIPGLNPLSGENLNDYLLTFKYEDSRNFRYLSLTTRSVRNDHHEIVAGITVIRDITDRRINEQKLKEAHKLAAIGEMAGNLAHEINNPMAIVAGLVEKIETQADGTKDSYRQIRSDCGKILATIKRMTKITTMLSNLARDSDEAPSDDHS